ncbi:hypothetical protein ERJ75_000706300 [Trypanosoma vivax]|uniref:Protein Abitram n=1 Tax=Trypanosoma vivax (strain Y486) TaxID=1055687 RepID=G0TU21_TRYVY|nr:hypothetical protein TRVL_00175 [Trypanosoma vivax]KAH8613563.1 hypothetical protein ERJ75_000706300 [Trypanosoma vivax]CCC47454.1 conserved hypothetical protein [Trypanosoma vivax Y486]
MACLHLTCVAAPKPSTFDYFTERYYHQYLVKDCKGLDGNNCRLMVHSNGICVLCLDDSHAAVQAFRCSTGDGSVTVSSIVLGSGRGNSQIGSGKLHVVGKRKRNAAVCQVDTKMCTITLSNGGVYCVPACVHGYVLELNTALLERPALAVEAPSGEGYIAIISLSHNKINLSEYTKLSSPSGGDVVEDDEVVDEKSKKAEPLQQGKETPVF